MMSGLRSPISFLLAAAPPAVGLVRYLNTGRDTRMLGAAVASMLGAFVAARVWSGRSGSSGFAIAVATATLSAVSAACAMYLLGARAGAGIWAIALVFGGCWGARMLLKEAK